MTGPPDFDEFAKATEEWLACNELIGLTETGVEALASAASVLVRVICRDGHRFSLRADLRANRINVELIDGRVSRIDGIY